MPKRNSNNLDVDHPLQGEVKAIDFICYNNHLLGQVLTIIDALGLQPDQKKATKDLIKRAMWSNYDPVWGWMNDLRKAKEGKLDGQYIQFPYSDSHSVE